MTQTGIVRRIEADTVWVEINCLDLAPGELAPSCCADARATIEARKPERMNVQVGDAVELDQARTSYLFLIVMVVFGLPLAGLFTAYGLAVAWGVVNEGARAAIGFGGLGLASLVPVSWFRWRRVRDERPLVKVR